MSSSISAISSAFEGHDEYIFAQQMMRDTIYDSLLKRQLKNYHAAAGDWLVETVGERLDEYTPLIAEHYELGEVNEKAAEYLIQAGDKALTIGVWSEAKTTLERALALLPEDDALHRAALQMKLGEAVQNLGDLDQATVLFNEALGTARQVSDF